MEVPQNHKRYICDLTQADRLAIYDYVLTETKNQRSRSQLTENDSDLFVDLAAKVNQGLEENFTAMLCISKNDKTCKMSLAEGSFFLFKWAANINPSPIFL